MNRPRSYIKSTIMINWRGIPFQVIDMDRLITALEGKNAAGKTTVLTAFYVAMLPDRGLIRVPNVGDAEGFGRESGLHGKLGGTGPAYTILELINPLNERIFAGVQLYARTAPLVEMDNTFVVKNLPTHVPVERILTFERNGQTFIPEISQIEQMVSVYGGDMEKYSKISDYGTALFSLGILPVDLSDRKNREKFNRLLQTSLLGGFSKKLQEKLKDYLLTEDTKTRDSVQHMQENLDRCRKTKKHLDNLSRKMSAVVEIYTTGREMMKALLDGIKLKEAQVREEVSHLRGLCNSAKEKYVAQRKAYKGILADIRRLDTQIAVAEEEVGTARDTLAKTEEAFGLEAKLAKERAELLDLREHRMTAEAALTTAESEYSEAAAKIGTLSEQMLDLAGRLSSAEEAWKKISQEAGLYRIACECLENARQALPDQEVSAETSRALLKECKDKKEERSKAASSIEQRLQSAEQLRAGFCEAVELLGAIAEEPVLPENAWDEALRVEKEYRDLANLIEMNRELPQAIHAVEGKAKAQSALKEKLEWLRAKEIPIASKSELLSAHAVISTELTSLGGQIEGANTIIASLKGQTSQLQETKRQVTKQCPLWDEAMSLRKELEGKYSVAFGRREDVDDHIKVLTQQKNMAIGNQAMLGQQINELDIKISDLVTHQNVVDSRMEKLEKELDGRLVASLYEDIDIDEAPEKEARLGPLINAIMVDDVQDALTKIEQMSERSIPEEVWLLEKSKLDSDVLRFYRRVGKSIVAQMDKAWRVTQFPERPKVGLQARKRLIAGLRAEKESKQGELKGVTDAIKDLDSEVSRLRTLAERFHILDGKNPHDAIADIEIDINGANEQISREDAQKRVFETIRRSKIEVAEVLTRMLPDSSLIDEEDYAQKLAGLKELLTQVSNAEARYLAKKQLLQQFERKMQNLRTIPPTEDDCEQLRGKLQAVNAEWEFWHHAENMLLQLIDKLEHFQFEKSFVQRQESEDPAKHLREESKKVQALCSQAREKLPEFENALNAARSSHSEILAAYDRKQCDITANENSLRELGVDGSGSALESARHNHAELNIDCSQLKVARNGLIGPEADTRSDTRTAKNRFRETWKAWNGAARKKLTLAVRVKEMAESCYSYDKTLASLLPVPHDTQPSFKSANTAFDEVKRQRGILESSVKHQAKDDGESSALVSGLLGLLENPSRFAESGEESKMLQSYIDLWKEVVVYISQILPRDCVYTDNPELAIEQMSERYRSLAETLDQQEKDFQADSRDVANSIRSRIKSEQSNVRKINMMLEGMSFGNIQSIKVDFTMHHDMMQILDAMQDKEQWNLFANDLPLTEAMKKIYVQQIGGKVQGDELLDYKQYINLTVKIRRKSSAEWESSFMSTGEAIGTGAAILMVILMTWERTNSFFKSKDLQNTLRFLFMDEATRLDSESIKTLVDFCRKFDIQFLLAGPKFDDEECGSGTTYRLVRTNTAGGEHVVMRGRRGFGGQSMAYGEDAA